MGWITKRSEFEAWYSQEFSLLHALQTGPGVHPTSYPMGTAGSFPGGKVAGVWNWQLTSNYCRGQENVDLYTHSPICLHCVVLNLSTGTTLPLIIIESSWHEKKNSFRSPIWSCIFQFSSCMGVFLDDTNLIDERFSYTAMRCLRDITWQVMGTAILFLM
jgi:hypothetical protein